MIFETHSLHHSLSKFIESIFYFKDFVAEHNFERVVPTGNIYLIFELDGFERKTYDNDLKPNGKYLRSWVSGMQQKHLNISVHQNSEMLVIQFRPAGSYPFFKFPVNQLNNKVVPGEVLFGDRILNLRNEMIGSQSIAGKFQIIERWLLEIFETEKIPPLEIFNIVEKMQSHPFSKHNEVIRDYPKTSKNLINQFKKYCGLTPKVLHRIFRFNTLLANIHQKEEIVWADIVYETGYSDQSHFIKEFQEFCGFNPSEFIKNRYNESTPNFFPLDT